MPKIDWDEMTDLFKCNRAFEQVSKAAAGTGTIGDFGRSKYHDDFHHESFNKMMNEAESKAREEIALKALLQNSQTKESNMELQRDIEKYKEFLQLVEESDWIRPNVYKIFYESSEMRRERLLTALYNRKINFQIRDKGKILDDGSQDIDNDYRLFIEDWYFSNSQSSSDCFVLEAESFLSWLKEEYPYEGKEQPKAKPKENDSAPSLSPKRESNLLKIIGGFVQTVYLKKDTGAYGNSDKPKISAIANAFSEALSNLDYSDEGFKDRNLRKIISDALEQIKENKKQENKKS